MNVRAKFRCNEVTEYPGGQRSAKFSPVTSGSDENKSFWAATPSSSLELNWTTSVEFKPGTEYYLDLTPALPAAAPAAAAST